MLAEAQSLQERMPPALRVLIVDDSIDDAELVLREIRRLGRPMESERVEDGPALRRALSATRWDLVISDWSMPKFSAHGALAVVKEMSVDIPFIIVTGTTGEDTAVEAMRAGAHDFVLKDKLARLVPAIERELREVRVRAERAEELRHSEDRYRAVFELSPLPMWLYDIQTLQFLVVNDATLRLYGYSREELLRMSIKDILGPGEAALVLEALHLAGERHHAPGRHRKKDGTIIEVDVTARPLMVEKRKCRLVVAQEVTEQRRLEEQLRQAQKMEAVGRLAGGVAHDFNNVLSVILSYSFLLISKLQSSDPMKGEVEEIQRAAQRAADLTRQLLAFSRQQVLQPKVLDMNEVLANMNKMLRRILGEDIDLTTIGAPALKTVKIDPGHLEQIMMNLVVNARDAMPTGGKLTIETSNVVLDENFAHAHFGTRAGPHIMLAVTDTGTGMDAKTRARIFEPFFTTKDAGKGTGLGLSTVFGIVQQAGGSIWVYSEPGRGTTFKIYLPAAETRGTPSASPPSASTVNGTETILLVEDEEQVRRVASGVLRQHGYCVLEARTAREAIACAEKHDGHIDLLLTDVVMPEMSGTALAEQLAKSRPEMRLLCMSGYTDDTVFRHGVLKSEIAFLQKPITPADLTRKVREVLDTPVSPTDAESQNTERNETLFHH